MPVLPNTDAEYEACAVAALDVRDLLQFRPPGMRVIQPQSLRRLLLTHEIAFVILVVISGALGATWAHFWQQWSQESIRLNYLAHTAQGIRSQLFKQIQEVSLAGLRQDPAARQLNSQHVGTIQEQFNELRRRSFNRAEDYAVQELQTAFSLLQANLRETLKDPYALNQLVRLKVLNPSFADRFVADFEVAFESFIGLIDLQLARQERVIQRWTGIAPYGLGGPILVGVGLLLFSRRSLNREFVVPMRAVMTGAREISGGNLRRAIAADGVAEMRELARGINSMAVELEASRNAARASERQSALGALVPVVAHNIRNPLAAIRANAQLLEAGESDEELAEIRQAILDTVDRLGRWVTSLVSYLHPLSPRLQATVAVDLFDSACALLAPRINQSAIVIEHASWDLQALIDTDPDLLEQALYGLLNNAIEASPRGATVCLDVSRDADNLRFAISDHAGGIPFRPAPSELMPGPSSKRFGTGLGIPIAFKICGVLGYQLEFDIATGVGTTAIVTAPLAMSTVSDASE